MNESSPLSTLNGGMDDNGNSCSLFSAGAFLCVYVVIGDYDARYRRM